MASIYHMRLDLLYNIFRQLKGVMNSNLFLQLDPFAFETYHLHVVQLKKILYMLIILRQLTLSHYFVHMVL